MEVIEVSVITPVRNGGQHIKNAVLSVEKQVYPCEHVIIDDSSEDDTWDILVKLKQDRPWIKIIQLPIKTGPIGARNVGIKNAKGRYIAFLDADDIWLPSKLKIQISFMKLANHAFTFTDYRCISHDQKRVGRRVSGLSKINWHLHHSTRFIACSSVIIDRSSFNEFTMRDVWPAKRGEDFLAWADCIKKCKNAVRCPHDLLFYSLSKNSRSAKKVSGAISMFLIYNKVEKISLIKTFLYLISYGLFSIVKIIWQKPNRAFN
jgi:teichuronic acid biosynthesis glycosyltransferase TuaG